MSHFTSTATREGRWWVVQCDQEPGAISQVARLDQAADHQREAIAFVADLDEADIEVEIVVALDEDVTDAIARARETREEAEHLAQLASESFREVARTMVEDAQLSLRDVGTVLGISHQRVAQLLEAPSSVKASVPKTTATGLPRSGKPARGSRQRSAVSGRFVTRSTAARRSAGSGTAKVEVQPEN